MSVLFSGYYFKETHKRPVTKTVYTRLITMVYIKSHCQLSQTQASVNYVKNKPPYRKHYATCTGQS